MSTDIGTAILMMNEPGEFGKLAARIAAECPDNLAFKFGTLHRQRGKLLEQAGSRDAAETEAWIAIVCERAALPHPPEGSYRIVSSRGAVDSDTLANWRKAPPSVYLNYWNHANSPGILPSLSAFLLQALWELRPLWKSQTLQGMPKPIDTAIESIKHHLLGADWILQPELEPMARGMRFSAHWETAFRLGNETGRLDLLSGAMCSLRSTQLALLSSAPHWSLSLTEIEIKLAAALLKQTEDGFESSRLEDILKHLEQIEVYADKAPCTRLVESRILDASVKLERMLNRPPDEKTIAQRKANLLESQVSRESSKLFSSLLLKEAAGWHQKAGNRTEASRALSKSREVVRQALNDGEFKQIESTVRVSLDDVDRDLEPFFKGSPEASVILMRLGCNLFSPSLGATEEGAQAQGSIAGEILGVVPMVDDRSLDDVPPGGPEMMIFQEHRSRILEITFFSETILSEAFRKLRSERSLHEEDISAVLSSSPFIEPEDLPFLRTIAERYMAGDRISTIHILVPRIEQIIRRMSFAGGLDTTALKSGAMKERTLGDLLREIDENSVLPHKVCLLLMALLTEEWGLNLRNRVAHGLLKPSECTQATLDRLLHTAIVLAGLRIKRDKPVRM